MKKWVKNYNKGAIMSKLKYKLNVLRKNYYQGWDACILKWIIYYVSTYIFIDVKVLEPY